MSPTPLLLHVEHLSVAIPTARGSVQAVRDASFTVQHGEILALVGESGSGKSVTAQAIMGLLPQHAIINSQALQTDRKKIAMIFQNPMATFNPVLSIGYQIAEPLRVLYGYSKKTAEDEAIRLLERMQVRDAKQKAQRYAHEFSGGMLQRAAIAMALACKPTLLIADEPTTALDVSSQAEVMTLLQELRREQQLGILLITHDLALVAQHADRIVVMYQGKTIETNNTAALLQHPQHAYTQTLIAALSTQQNPSDLLTKPNAALHLLHIKNLYKTFSGQKRHTLKNINFTVEQGDIVGLAGESGSGKSTLARCIAGLHTYESGEIFFDGEPLPHHFTAAHFQQQSRHVQMIFQDPLSSVNPRLTIGEILLEPLRLNHIGTPTEQREKATWWMQRIGLQEKDLTRYPHSFSGGQLQRIGIARALINQPRLLICDEPVSALDVTTQANILSLLKQLRTELGLTLLFISHDLATMQHFCDRIAVMKDGEIIEQGAVVDVLNQPQHPYTQHLMSCSPSLTFLQSDAANL
jgi:peptide/nickel transport system ATP-binding protein